MKSGRKICIRTLNGRKEILAQQDENGLWGNFHTLSKPSKAPITTEQALRRLYV